jgi:hypothetical protein
MVVGECALIVGLLITLPSFDKIRRQKEDF